MGGAAHALKRIPRIKFPQRHPKPSTSGSSSSQTQATSASGDAPGNFFSRPPSMTPGGKASDQPKRTPVSEQEIEAILISNSDPLNTVFERNLSGVIYWSFGPLVLVVEVLIFSKLLKDHVSEFVEVLLFYPVNLNSCYMFLSTKQYEAYDSGWLFGYGIANSDMQHG
ncbi:hypothetical protein ACH5RR_038315 [Cinchona calisaya]|uniref:Uncharacterized protein n=1 Tax=Cinchona calisaya TaxID=153742 RepID=A0ABD2XY77_9GENT